MPGNTGESKHFFTNNYICLKDASLNKIQTSFKALKNTVGCCVKHTVFLQFF